MQEALLSEAALLHNNSTFITAKLTYLNKFELEEE